MNSFVEHHRESIELQYSCFDRILRNAIIQPLQRPPIIVGYLDKCKHVPSITRVYFRQVSEDYHRWVQDLAARDGIQIVEPPKGVRRERWVEPFYETLGTRYGIAVILKSRENARVAVSYATATGGNRIEVYRRFVWQDYFYLRDRDFGRMFVRLCPYFPFNARIYLNGHAWLARQMERGGIAFDQAANAFLACSKPERLQLDLNRTIGRPDKLSVVFGHRITKSSAGGLKTQIADYHLGNPVIRSESKQASITQYVRDHRLLRTEATSYHTPDLGVGKSVEHLPRLRQVMAAINERYLTTQQDVLETYIDRGHLARLREATVSPSGRRTPGLKLDDPRLLAVMQAVTRFVHLARGGSFRTRDLHQSAAEALGRTTETYRLGQLRYDLAKLRAKGLVLKVVGTQTYRLTEAGFRICVLFLKLFHRVYAPLTAAALDPVPHDSRLSETHRSTLDRLYTAVDQALDLLVDQLGLRAAA